MSPLNENDITIWSAVELADKIRARELSCVEVADTFLRKIDACNPALNAFCTIAHDSALTAACEADRRLAAGDAVGPLHGLPIALKDLSSTRDIRTTRGSRLFAEHVPDTDAPLVERLRAAGAIVVGKTNTSEFGHKAIADNALFGMTRNPWCPDRIAGGSSGGSAAAVAAALVPFAEGSDGAGSIRIPASLCGVFGFKPTYGRVPDVAGGFSSHSPFFHNGSIARSVADGALLYSAMAGHYDHHPFSLPNETIDVDALAQSIAGMRIGYSADLGRFAVSAEVRHACEHAAREFERLGCVVEDADLVLPLDIEDAFYTLWRIKLAGNFGGLPPEQMALLDPAVQQLIEEGMALRVLDYAHANRVRETLWNTLAASFDRYDLLLCPTVSVSAFPVGEAPPATIEGRLVDPLLGWFLTYPFNLTVIRLHRCHVRSNRVPRRSACR